MFVEAFKHTIGEEEEDVQDQLSQNSNVPTIPIMLMLRNQCLSNYKICSHTIASTSISNRTLSLKLCSFFIQHA